MAAPQNEEPGFEIDVNELPDSDNGPEDSLEDKPPNASNPDNLMEAQKEGAEEREDGGLY